MVVIHMYTARAMFYCQHIVRPDLGPNCLQKLSAGDKGI